MSVRVDRHLDWVTLNDQSYPRRSAADWLDAVRRQLCPFCGAGPFTVVAAHVNRRHGLDRREFRDLLGLPLGDSICDEFHSAACREHGKRVSAQRDMSVISRSSGYVRRKTSATVEANKRRTVDRECVVCGCQLSDSQRQIGRRTCSETCRRQRQSDAAKSARARDVRPIEMYRFICPVCRESAEKPAFQVRANRKQGWAGPFCGMSCAGKYRQAKRSEGRWSDD